MVRVENRKEQGQPQEESGAVFGDFGQRRAGAGAEQGIRRRAAEGDARAGLLLGQLNQNEQDQKQTVQHEHDRQEANQQIHHNRFLIKCCS